MLLFLDPLLASLILVPSPFFPLCTPRDRAETSFHSACLTHAILVALLPDLGRFFVILKRNNRKKTGTSKNREKIKKRNLLKFKVYYLLKKSFQVFFLSFRYQVIFFFSDPCRYRPVFAFLFRFKHPPSTLFFFAKTSVKLPGKRPFPFQIL